MGKHSHALPVQRCMPACMRCISRDWSRMWRELYRIFGAGEATRSGSFACPRLAARRGSPGFTAAVHAATPHIDGRKRGCSRRAWLSHTLHAGRGVGKPGFPIPPLRGPMFTVDGHAHGAPRRDDHDLGARASRPRYGAAGTAPAPSPAGGGNPAPPPSGGRLGGGLHAANDVHLRQGCLPRRGTGRPGRPGAYSVL